MNTLRFVSGSSELNLLHLSFFSNGKDPLEDFDYNDPHCNPLLRSTTARTPSNTTAHQLASCVCLTHFFIVSLGCLLRSSCPFLDQLGRTLTVPAKLSYARPAWSSPYCSSLDILYCTSSGIPSLFQLWTSSIGPARASPYCSNLDYFSICTAISALFQLAAMLLQCFIQFGSITVSARFHCRFLMRPVLSPPKRSNELRRDIRRFLAKFLRLDLRNRV
ncbi:hypothetical protein F511_10043 [Dorcoceras hygrometricum]|uniref:Uncharacterized protein n=1 Tax=Dorcoceras hygrometricum TaxID=472368 RepID=A0A2Z7ABT7_9LAMI|nr:hypothetical protein F511_10043 [Dorcoceras hygrometricum]